MKHIIPIGVILWCLGVPWASAQEIVIHPNATAYVPKLEYAAWAWSLRTGMDVEYIGQTAEPNCELGKITVRVAGVQEWQANGMPLIGGPAAFTGKCHGTGPGYIIVISPTVSPGQGVIAHEVGHALGYWSHSSDHKTIMRTPVAIDWVTAPDALGVLATPHYPIATSGDLCAVELTADMGLYIPDIEGQTARLDYDGEVNGYHQWSVRHGGPSAVSCPDNVMTGTDAYLDRIVSYEGPLYTGVLRAVGDAWRAVHIQQIRD